MWLSGFLWFLSNISSKSLFIENLRKSAMKAGFFCHKCRGYCANFSSNTKAATRGVLWKKLFLEISQNWQENTGVRASFLIKLQAWPATLLKKRLWHRCFPVNFVKFLRTPFLTEYLQWLLLVTIHAFVDSNPVHGNFYCCLVTSFGR